jgi:leucine dehydrogenase
MISPEVDPPLRAIFRPDDLRMSVFAQLADEYEEVVFLHDPPSGLRAIVAIHSTALGPSLGGTRFYPFATEEEALRDVLRLARGMTYKAAVAGLDLGGGKAVIIGDPRRDKSERMLRAYGRFIDSLGGRYITAVDVGTAREDMDTLRRETPWVTGVSERFGGSGDPSPITAYGVFQGLRACAEEALGTSSLEGVRVVIQGVGKVGYHLAKHLVEEGSRVTVADVDVDAVARAVRELGVDTAEPEKAHAVESEIFAPCALGAVIRDDTLSELKCRIVAGAANNQLERQEHGDALADLGILYAPDFVINSGGLMNVADELIGYDRERAMAKVEGIYRTLREVFRVSRVDGIAPAVAAIRLADERIEGVSRVRLLWVPGRDQRGT